MRRSLGALVIFVVILLVGGVFTAGIFGGVPMIIQSQNPDASVFQATPEQANQFIIWIAFVIINVIGAGVTLALLFWFGNRELKVVERQGSDAEQLPAE
ncbi:hypothetical protein G4Y79_13875 [Phototrophicus methaneseepsis]|uniref:Uncharacterized protein n=1 Tax=Phototrophicus methaneseepsis TaxID=2710758 RepID=A0A7S8E5L7_9CHLR|nr:hypothetical protein [Phototrophicus methaneseepsis]QPC80797.1 hypothetical protein G4Y79_13875 [Phototrophicus methaneseepsis]